MTDTPAPRWTALLVVLAGVALVVDGIVGRPLLLGVGLALGLPITALGLFWWRQR